MTSRRRRSSSGITSSSLKMGMMSERVGRGIAGRYTGNSFEGEGPRADPTKFANSGRWLGVDVYPEVPVSGGRFGRLVVPLEKEEFVVAFGAQTVRFLLEFLGQRSAQIRSHLVVAQEDVVD